MPVGGRVVAVEAAAVARVVAAAIPDADVEVSIRAELHIADVVHADWRRNVVEEDVLGGAIYGVVVFQLEP